MLGYSRLPNDQSDNIAHLIDLFEQLDPDYSHYYRHDTFQAIDNINILKEIAIAIALEKDFCPPSNKERFDGFINPLRKHEFENLSHRIKKLRACLGEYRNVVSVTESSLSRMPFMRVDSLHDEGWRLKALALLNQEANAKGENVNDVEDSEVIEDYVKKKIQEMENKKNEMRKDIDVAASPYIEFINLCLKRNSNAKKLKDYELDKKDFSFMRLFYRKLGGFFFLTVHLSETYALLLAPRSNNIRNMVRNSEIFRNIGTFVGFFLGALVSVVVFPFTVIKSIVDYKNKYDEKIVLTEKLNKSNEAVLDKLSSLAEGSYLLGKLYEEQGMDLKAAESYVQIDPDHASDYEDYIEVMFKSAENMYRDKHYELAKVCLQKALLVDAETPQDKTHQDYCRRLINPVVSALENKKLIGSEKGWDLSDETRDPSKEHLKWLASLQRRIYDDSLNKTGFFGRETIRLTVKNEQGVKMPKQEVNVHAGIKMILDEMEKFRRGQSTTADACQNIQAIARKQLKDNPSSFFNTVHKSEVDLYKSIVSSTVMARC